MTDQTDEPNPVLAQFRTNMGRPAVARWELDADDVEALAGILDDHCRALFEVYKSLTLDGADASQVNRERDHARTLRESLLELRGELKARAAR